MRNAILASLLFSPVLLHAQANSPAQTKVTLESRLAAPAELAPAADHTTPTKALRISTGVVPPRIIHSVDVSLDSSNPTNFYTGPRKLVVAMVVGTDGTPSDLKIVQSAGPIVDRSVLESVSQYRFAPGTVSNQPTAIPVNLEITITGTNP